MAILTAITVLFILLIYGAAIYASLKATDVIMKKITGRGFFYTLKVFFKIEREDMNDMRQRIRRYIFIRRWLRKNKRWHKCWHKCRHKLRALNRELTKRGMPCVYHL